MPISSSTLRRGVRLTFFGLSLLALRPQSFADEPLLPPPPDSAVPTDSGAALSPEAGPAPTPEEMPALAPPPDSAAAPPAEQPTAPLPPSTESTPVEAAPKEVPKPGEKATQEPQVEKPVAVAPTPSPTPKAAKPPVAQASPSPVPIVSATPEPEIQAAEPKTEPSPEPTPEPTPSVAAETPPQPEPTPEPSAPTHDSNSSRHHGQVPEYQKVRPQWAVEFIGSPSALGTDDISNDFTGHPLAYDLHFEFQPAFLQAIGVIGFGPTVGLYMFPSDQNISASPGSVWTVGFEGRYQARFFREQLVVPVVGYAAERINYHFQTGGGVAGSLIAEGPVFGLWLLLNRFEPDVAEEMFKQNGVSRSYAVVEARDLEGSDDYLTISGFSFFFGLRIEF